MKALTANIKHLVANPKEARKAATALVTSAVLLTGSHLLPGQVGVWLQALQPLLLFYGVWRVPNADATPVVGS